MIELQTSHSARPQCGSHVMKSNGKFVLPSLNLDFSWINLVAVIYKVNEANDSKFFKGKRKKIMFKRTKVKQITFLKTRK